MISFIRAVLLAVIAWIVGRALARLAFGDRSGSPAGSGSGARRTTSPERPERLVEDPVCGVRLPEGRALRVVTDEGPVFFCSDECRRAHEAGSATG